MNLYLMFMTMATLTILSPGPGVLKSLTNAIHYGRQQAFVGILGLACGVLCVALLSATSIGLILASSQLAFTIVKTLGAAYLIYLGIRMLLSRSDSAASQQQPERSMMATFTEGLLLQFTNPKAILFFMAILPQFIDHSKAYVPQFLLLVVTFCTLLVLIHTLYVLGARKVSGWLAGTQTNWLNKAGACAFLMFGAMLLGSDAKR